MRISAASLLAVSIAVTALLPASTSAQSLSSLSGSVTSSAGEPIPRARVMALTADESDTLAVLFTNAAGSFSDQFSAVVSIEESGTDDPNEFKLLAVYPNPVAGGETTVRLAYRAPLGQATPTAELFDVLGRRLSPESHLGSGLYFIRLRAGGSADAISDAKTLVLTSPGSVRLELEPIQGLIDAGFSAGPNGAPVTKAAKSANAAAGASGASTAVLLRVDKAGFITQERSIDLDPQIPATENFQLDVAAAPTASFTFGGTTKAGAAVTFDATASAGNGDLMYAWDFGDGLRGGGREVAHVYTADGDFTVTLTVVAEYGATASHVLQVSVDPADPPIADNGTLKGSVADIAGYGLSDVTATIVGTELTGTTNPFGMVEVEGVPVGVPLTVRLERIGYASQVVQVGIAADTSSTLYFEAAMRARDTAIEVDDAENGFMKRMRDGVMVQLPVDGLMHEDGSMATGPVQVSMTPVDVADAEEVRSFPGRFGGLRPSGDEALLLSLGVAEYNFEQFGAPLQLAPGKTAKIEIPIYTSGAVVGEEIPLWSMNETTGAWVEEGVGVVQASASSPSGLVLVGEVTHFSWWNIDKPDTDPDEAEGLCYKYECFNGICNKVKVFCWVEGAIRGDTDKRAQLDPPVFTARQFFPAEGGAVPLPGNTEITLRGSIVLDNLLLRGDTTFTAVAGGNSQFELVLDTAFVAEVGQVQLPLDTTGTFENAGEFDIMEFEGTAGQVIGYRGTRVSGPSTPAVIELKASDGTVISTRSVDDNVIPVLLPTDDTYSFVVTATQSVAASYRLRVEKVSGVMAVNSNSEIALSPGGFRILEFNYTGQRDLIAGVRATGGIRKANIGIWDGELKPIGSTISKPDTGPFTPAPGSNYLFLNAIPATQSPIRVGLSEVPDPVTLEFDEHGVAEVQTSFAYHGQHRYYHFDAESMDGLEVALYRRGDGVEDAFFRVYDSDGDFIVFPSVNSGWADSLVFGWSDSFSYTGTFLIDLQDERYASTGGLRFSVRRVKPSQNIVVDDDLSCPNATTPSLAAALRAAQDGTSIFICDGDYNSPSRLVLENKDNVTIEGESEAGVVVRFGDENRNPPSILDVQGRNVLVRNLTLQAPGTPSNQTTGAIRTSNTLEGNVITFENITIEHDPDATYATLLFGINGDFESVEVRDITSGASADLRSGNTLVENTQLRNAVYLRRSGNENAQIHVRNSTFENANVSISNAMKGMFEDSFVDGSISVANSNSVTIRNVEFDYSSTFPVDAISVASTDSTWIDNNATERPITVTVGENQYAELTRNRLYAGSDFEMLTLNHVHNQTGGTIIAANNVIEAKRGFFGNIRIYYPDLFGSLLFGNNTFMVEQLGNTVDVVTSVGLTLRDNAFTGDLPVSFINNIFIGDGTTVFGVPENTSIDADYNLYFNHVRVVSDGATNRTGTNDLSGQDPLLTGDDLEPQAGSPAIDSGASGGMFPWLPLIDFTGTARPQGSGYDRGAWEN